MAALYSHLQDNLQFIFRQYCSQRSTLQSHAGMLCFKHAAKTIMPALVAHPSFGIAARPLSRPARLRSVMSCATAYQMPAVERKVEEARSQHLVEQTMDQLKERRHAITTVESCTGGMLANLLTNVGGAAEVYWGSVVTYDGSLKSDWGVPAGSIKDVGTVTEQVRNVFDNGSNPLGQQVLLHLSCPVNMLTCYC